MPSEAQVEEMEERAKELMEEYDTEFNLAYYAVCLEVALRENMYSLIRVRGTEEEYEQLVNAVAEGEILAFAKGEYAES